MSIPEATMGYDRVMAYLDRKKLAEVGVTVRSEAMSSIDAESLIMVSDAFVHEENDKMRREAKGGKQR